MNHKTANNFHPQLLVFNFLKCMIVYSIFPSNFSQNGNLMFVNLLNSVTCFALIRKYMLSFIKNVFLVLFSFTLVLLMFSFFYYFLTAFGFEIKNMSQAIPKLKSPNSWSPPYYDSTQLTWPQQSTIKCHSELVAQHSFLCQSLLLQHFDWFNYTII